MARETLTTVRDADNIKRDADNGEREAIKRERLTMARETLTTVSKCMRLGLAYVDISLVSEVVTPIGS